MSKDRVSFTGRDSREVKDDLVEMIPNLTDRWTDFHESDPGMVIIDLLAYLSDQLSFYIDHEALESNYITALERKNVYSSLRPLGYQLHGYNSAETYVKLRSEHSHDVYINQYDVFSTEKEDGEVYYFSAMKDVTVPPNLSGIVTLPLMEGLKKEFNFVYDDLDEESRIQLPNERIADNSIRLFVNGVEWIKVDDAQFYEGLDQVFNVEYSREGYPVIRLIKGWENLLNDPQGVNIEIIGLESSGAAGNIGSNTVMKIVSTLVDELGNTDCTNTISDIIHDDEISGGADPETIEEAKANAPKRIRTMWTVVTLEDYENYCETEPSIDRCLALDWSVEGSYIEDPYLVELILVPEDSTIVSDAVKDSLYKDLMKRRMTPLRITMGDPDYVDIDIEVKGYVNPGYQQKDNLRIRVEEVIEDYFTASNRDFADVIRPASIRYEIESEIDDLLLVDLISPESNNPLEINQFPRVGNLKVSIEEEEL